MVMPRSDGLELLSRIRSRSDVPVILFTARGSVQSAASAFKAGNRAEWLRSRWTDLHSSEEYRIRSKGHSSPAAIRVQTHRDTLERFRTHPESKSADPDGNPSNERTVGLLRRLPIEPLCIFHIGKETNLIEQQEEGVLLADPQQVYSIAGEWEAIRSELDRVSIPELAERSGVSPRMLRNLRKGDRRPSAKTLEAIAAALVRMLE